MLERLDLGMLHLDRKRRVGQRFEVVVAEFAAAAVAAVVGHVLRTSTQQVGSVVVVVGDGVAVEVAVEAAAEAAAEAAVEAAAEDKAFVKSVGTVPVQTEGTVPRRRGHRKLALVGMHMQGQGVAVVQDEAGIGADARADADKHYWGLHTHMAGVGRNCIHMVVLSADRNHTSRCDAQGCLPLSDQISSVLSQRTRSSIPNQPASGCTCQ